MSDADVQTLIKLKRIIRPENESITTLPSITKSVAKPLSISLADNRTSFQSEEMLSLPSPYPPSRFKLNVTQIKKWLSKKVEEKEEEELSEHELNIDEEDPIIQTEPISPKQPPPSTPVRVGPRAIKDFYMKFKNINKITSPVHLNKHSASLRYLQQIDKEYHIPHPMGLVKWNGKPNELNLQYFSSCKL